MTPSDLEDMKTVCCGANYIRLGHQRYICDDCKEDKSFEFMLMADAVDRADAADRVRRLGQWGLSTCCNAPIIHKLDSKICGNDNCRKVIR